MTSPDPDAVSAVAAASHIRIDPEEIHHVQRLLQALLPAAAEAEDVLRLGSPPEAASGRSGERTHWASDGRDRWNALIHGCQVRDKSGGALAGKRVAIKDCVMVRGLPMTAGTRFLDGYVSDRDATVVSRLLEAGAEIVGTANMEPFACGVGLAGHRDYGIVDNPIAPGYSAGGSSSGSAAAVAGGLADFSIGTDTHGSVRLPAAWCGLVGLKPTHGRVPHTGVLGHEFFHDHVGPMAADVATVLAVLAVISGPDGHDARCTPVPSADPCQVRRVGVLAESIGPGCEPAVAEAFDQTVAQLQDAGFAVQRISVPAHRSLPAVQMPYFYTAIGAWWHSGLVGQAQDGLLSPSLTDAIAAAMRNPESSLPLFVRSLAAAGSYLQHHYGQHFAAHATATRQQARRAYDAVWADVDVLVMPTIPVQARRYERGTDLQHDLELAATGGSVTLAELSTLTMNTSPFNFTGHPALTVPIERNAAGSIGMQLVGPFGDDERIIEFATVIEQIRARSGTHNE